MYLYIAIAFFALVFSYLVLLVDIPSSDPWELCAAQDIQSEFCSSGCLSGSFEHPVHGTCWSTKSLINEWNSDQLMHTGPEKWKKEIKVRWLL